MSLTSKRAFAIFLMLILLLRARYGTECDRVYRGKPVLSRPGDELALKKARGAGRTVPKLSPDIAK